jgi:hypothetical protein
VEGGGLLAYAVDFSAMFRQSPRLIDKIFKGAQPSDIPVEQVTTFDLVINLRAQNESMTSQAGMMACPQLARADVRPLTRDSGSTQSGPQIGIRNADSFEP